jgi:15-cis-phytoene synthase
MNRESTAEYCRLKAAEPGTNFYYATLYYAPEIRRKLFCLHAFGNELAGIIAECTDPGVARMKLAWWYEEVQRLYKKQPRHPVTKEFMHTLTGRVDMENFLAQLIDYYDQQVSFLQPQTYSELMDFLQRGQGLLWRYSADICTYQHSQTPEMISEMGCHFGYFQILQNVPLNERMNRYYWPIEEVNNTHDKTGLYAFQVERLLNRLEEYNEKLPSIDRKSQRYAIIMAQIICTICREIAQSGYRLSEERITLTPFRKLWITWRTHMKER